MTEDRSASRSGARVVCALAAAFFMTLAVAACADIKPLDYTPADEIPPGPGLLSGQDGEFKIFRR